MKKSAASESGFFTLRVLLALLLCSAGVALSVLALATPMAASRTGTETARRSGLARLDPDPLSVNGAVIAELKRFLSPARWLASVAPKRTVSAAATMGSRPTAPAGGMPTPFVSEAVDATVSPAVRDLPAANEFSNSIREREEGQLRNRTPQFPRDPAEHDPVIQSTTAPTVGMPSVGVSFDGIVNSQACNGCIPPDPNGAVGPNHYVQMVNSAFAIYSKTGAVLSAPKAINTLWAATPNSTCATHNNGDPIVIYDQLADRWLLSQFTVQSGSENYAECIAISQTPDPTGAYWLYQFDESNTVFHDYPHIGIWPDGYYMSTNLFGGLVLSSGAGAWAFERPKMLLGQAARYVYFDETPLATETYTPGGQLPTSLEGTNLPPAGAPNYFVEVSDTNTPNTPPATGLHDELHIWQFHVDWTTPANSTFGIGSSAPAAKPGFSGQFAGNAGGPNFVIPVADYVPVPCLYADGPNCIPQKQSPPNQPEYLDVLGDRLMYRVTYRNFGDHESLLLSHTALGPADQPGGVARAGVRWYELRNVSTTPAVYQQSTFAPLDPANLDGPLWRWMGSAAMDHSGDIAIGYSASGPNYFPSLHYAGRLAGDPLNELTQGEAVLFAGLGIEVAVPNYLQRNRWGDYSNLTVDPTDDCTFWYTNEYCPVNGPLDGIAPVEWRTRIGSFKFPQCVSVPVLTGVVSRKVHGGAGTFDIPLPGIECRSGGANGDHDVVFSFASAALPVNVATCSGNAATTTTSGNETTVHCTGLANAQNSTIAIDSLSVVMGVLLGDSTANGTVNSSDIGQAKGNSGQTTTAANFRTDVTVNGAINSSDIGTIKAQSGTSLP